MVRQYHAIDFFLKKFCFQDISILFKINIPFMLEDISNLHYFIQTNLLLANTNWSYYQKSYNNNKDNM